MNEGARVRIVLPAVAAAVLSAAAANALSATYLNEDVRIQGNEIHSFADAGQQVSVVLGDFRLTLGKRVITGRDAVLWVASRPAGRLAYHDIIAYVEGDAKVAEPGGSETSDRAMVVEVHSLGRLSASGHMSDRPLKDFPLYRRALAARQQGVRRPIGQGPLSPPTRPAEASTKAAATSPAGPPGPAVRITPASQVPAPARQPVSFHAARVSSQEMEQEGVKTRVTVARGEVYLSQGDPDSDLFLELRSQSAVIFSRQQAPKDSNVPYAPAIQGIQAPGGGQEVVTGVYLDGDVVVSRGERYLRAPKAYYDFTANRALILDPVFRTIQQPRDIPIYVRAKQARVLSEREVLFQDAKVSTSDFYTPSYSIAASSADFKDLTPYDEKGVALGENRWLAHLKDVTYNVYGLPVSYWPEVKSEFEHAPTPLRRVQVGNHGRFGFGVESDWDLFRLLGMVAPDGFKGTLELDWYDRGPLAGAELEYSRESFSGYNLLYGVIDNQDNDDFGEDRENVPAPRNRGRVLARHKQYLPNDWELQMELSYLCDRNFLEQYFPAEFYTGKEQETLLYAKKQRDNWAFTALAQYRLNRFQTQTESAPDLGFFLIGEPLLQDRLTFFSESHAGLKRLRLDEADTKAHGDFLVRLDTRNEVDWPLHCGPLNVTPYAVGRVTYWSRSMDDVLVGDGDEEADIEGGRTCRLYGQLGVKANTHIWRLYPNAQSRLWDLNGLKHVLTPEVVAFLGEAARGVEPDHLYPMDEGIELHLRRLSGASAGVRQRLQTRRGPADNRKTVDWMKLDVIASFYDDETSIQPADGRFFFSRPEYSIARNSINADYTWNISDSTALLAYENFDLTTGQVRLWNVGLAVSREPRLRYYAGVRRIADLDSSVATGAVTYKINPKYTLSFLEQIDMDFDGHETLASSISLIRKFPRWYVGATFFMDRRTDDLGFFITLWPEGIPEFAIGSGRLALLPESTMN